jgi:hypothetical protein
MRLRIVTQLRLLQVAIQLAYLQARCSIPNIVPCSGTITGCYLKDSEVISILYFKII